MVVVRHGVRLDAAYNYKEIHSAVRELQSWLCVHRSCVCGSLQSCEHVRLLQHDFISNQTQKTDEDGSHSTPAQQQQQTS